MLHSTTEIPNSTNFFLKILVCSLHGGSKLLWCSVSSSLPHMGSYFLKSLPVFCSSLHQLTSRWPHLSLPAHVSSHLHKKPVSLACQSCFIGHQVKQAIICYQHALPGRPGTILERFLREVSIEQFQHEESCGSLLCVGTGTCKVILGMQVKRQCGIKIPRLYFKGFYPCSKTSQKHARNSSAFILTKPTLRLHLNTLQLKQKLTSRAL